MDYLGQPSSDTPKYNALVAFTSSPSLVLTGFPSTTTAGSPNDLTVIAYGPDGKIDTDFTGTVEFTSSDPKAVLPASYTFTPADGGVHTFPISLLTAGLQSITVTDAAAGLSREQSFITVQPSKAVSLAVTGFPNPDTAGVANPLQVTAYDAYGNVATGYTGTLDISISDPKAAFPTSVTLTAANGGIRCIWATLRTAGVQSITVTDPADGLSATESGITVKPAAATSLAIVGLPTT